MPRPKPRGSKKEFRVSRRSFDKHTRELPKKRRYKAIPLNALVTGPHRSPDGTEYYIATGAGDLHFFRIKRTKKWHIFSPPDQMKRKKQKEPKKRKAPWAFAFK